MRMYASQIPPTPGLARIIKQTWRKARPILLKQGPTNTHTYDAIYTNIKIREQASVLLHNAGGLMQVYTPFLEPEVLNLGNNMPRRLRAFNRFHRRIMTRLNPAVAAIPTTDSGSTASARPWLLAGDIAKNGWGKGGRLLQKWTQNQPTPAAGFTEAKNPVVQQVVERSLHQLRESRLFSDAAPRTSAELPQQLWGRIITLGKLLERI